MGIQYIEKERVFILQSNNSTYALQAQEDGFLLHLYWGDQIKNIKANHLMEHRFRASFSPNPVKGKPWLTLDDTELEYPAYGTSDYRSPAFEIQYDDGSSISDFRYHSYVIYQGKPGLKGLPATYVHHESEAQTLEITMVDELKNMRLILSYTVFEALDVITRNARFINDGTSEVILKRALSMSVDFVGMEYDLLHLHGSWARERHMERSPLIRGTLSVDSKRGSSSHQQNPFIALLSKDATETNGQVYGFSLVYSGSFIAQAEVSQFEATRVSMGISPFDFSWVLESGESFQTPECVMVYSGKGLGEMSRTYHKLYRSRLCRGEFRDKSRPVLVNNWEGTYFDFTAKKLLDIASVAKDLGIELFVLDDGWFGKRNSDASSLGDWVVNREKLPEGLESLATDMNQLGLEFGLWFEPEMVSPESDLFKAHPDWILHVEGRSASEGRNQCILDLSRKEVCDYIIESLSAILSKVNIRYVKWDMNRNMTEIGSKGRDPKRQRETAHRYMLGLYQVLETITAKYPKILFESCSGGGGRFDPGMLYYMPQTWTSDDSDAVERLKIQYGTSIVYPISTMGAHVSAVPNHQVHRTTSLKMRGDVAMSGNFGYELDLSALQESEKKEMKEQITRYKELRGLIQFGDLYRLKNPFEGNETAWMIVSADQKEAFVAFFRVLSVAHAPKQVLKLQGLDPEIAYEVEGEEDVFYGDELMHAGLRVPNLEGDFVSKVWYLKAK